VHSVKLFSVKMLHLKQREYTIIIKVAASKPKLDARVRSFVLFGETKICAQAPRTTNAHNHRDTVSPLTSNTTQH
jgi:hypothetical protein